MEESILDYIKSTFTIEAARMLIDALKVMELYSYDLINESLIGVIGTHGQRHPEDTMDAVRQTINASLHAICLASGFKLTDDAEIPVLVLFLKTLSLVSDLEDHEPVMQIMETLESDIDKFGNVMQIYGPMSEYDYYSAIVDVEASLLEAMRRVANNKTLVANTATEVNNKYSKALKAFNHKFGPNAVGAQLVRSGVGVGESVFVYLAYARDYIKAPAVEQTAKNILSILLISNESCDEPYQYITSNYEAFDLTLAEITPISNFILNWSSELSKIEV